MYGFLTGYDEDFIVKYRVANADFKILQNFNADFGLPTSSFARELHDWLFEIYGLRSINGQNLRILATLPDT
jgi:hypothetical protein